ncbi:hypothetical protein [Clostridium fallax]|uniref:Uncharacterized protein n=1 Tax=Clostridium fallax TaxID=1533 RepID=A0A1M4VVA9_9CLOT|nr:hypothetical protein [Clostridium fallax]SHE72888.1 hypothetical protein SAMN05443638_10940 [Clostridium fallax]SQB07712.1 Uncharacterised protein [Clostridium fallax]
MDSVISKIIEIDKDAETLRSNIKLLVKEQQNEIKKRINILEKQWEEEAKHIKESIYNEKVDEAHCIGQNIVKEKNKTLQEMRLKYEENKNYIVMEVVKEILT